MRMWILRLLEVAALILVPVSSPAASGALLTVRTVPQTALRSVAIGAQRVPMLRMKLEASCVEAVSLESITLRHQGLGDPADILRLYGFVNDMRKTRGASVAGSEGIATLRFRGMKIPACASVTIDVLADISASAAAAGEHTFSLIGESDVDADADATVLLQESYVRAVARPVGKSEGTITVEYLGLPRPLTYGAARTVARVRLTGDAIWDQRIYRITFTNDGKARDADLENLVLETGGHKTACGPISSMQGDRATLVCNPPLMLRRREVKALSLRADIRASRRRTVEFVIEEPADIEARSVR